MAGSSPTLLARSLSLQTETHHVHSFNPRTAAHQVHSFNPRTAAHQVHSAKLQTTAHQALSPIFQTAANRSRRYQSAPRLRRLGLHRLPHDRWPLRCKPPREGQLQHWLRTLTRRRRRRRRWRLVFGSLVSMIRWWWWGSSRWRMLRSELAPIQPSSRGAWTTPIWPSTGGR
jgi:hypothetical protein